MNEMQKCWIWKYFHIHLCRNSYTPKSIVTFFIIQSYQNFKFDETVIESNALMCKGFVCSWIKGVILLMCCLMLIWAWKLHYLNRNFTFDAFSFFSLETNHHPTTFGFNSTYLPDFGPGNQFESWMLPLGWSMKVDFIPQVEFYF